MFTLDVKQQCKCTRQLTNIKILGNKASIFTLYLLFMNAIIFHLNEIHREQIDEYIDVTKNNNDNKNGSTTFENPVINYLGCGKGIGEA